MNFLCEEYWLLKMLGTDEWCRARLTVMETEKESQLLRQCWVNTHKHTRGHLLSKTLGFAVIKCQFILNQIYRVGWPCPVTHCWAVQNTNTHVCLHMLTQQSVSVDWWMCLKNDDQTQTVIFHLRRGCWEKSDTRVVPGMSPSELW